MSPETAALVRLSGALASRDPAQVRRAMEVADRDCETDRVEEILLQAYLFVGFPIALGAFRIWREVTGREAPPGRTEDPGGWHERGEDVCRRIYGSRYRNLRENVAQLHPEIDHWMIFEGYGKVLGRGGVPIEVRELSIVGLLAVLDTPAPLYSHLRGALAMGASPADVEAAIRSVEDLMSPEGATRAWDAWSRLSARG